MCPRRTGDKGGQRGLDRRHPPEHQAHDLDLPLTELDGVVVDERLRCRTA